MAYVPVVGRLYFPNLPTAETATARPSSSFTTVDADNEGVGGVYYTNVALTIRDIGIGISVTTTAGDLSVRVETVTADGLPSGTLVGTNTSATLTLVAADDNVYKQVTLTSDASIPADSYFAVVTQRLNPSLVVTQIRTAVGFGPLGFPAGVARTTAAWLANVVPMVAMFDTSGNVIEIPGNATYWNQAAQSATSATSPDSIGNTFEVPFQCKVNECWIQADVDGDCTIRIIGADGTTTVGSSATILTSTFANANYGTIRFPFPDEIELFPSTVYRIVCEPTTESAVAITELQFGTSAARSAYPGTLNLKKTTAKDPSGLGSWTDTNTSILMIGIGVSQIDIPTGGGGGLAANVIRGFIA